MKISVNDEHLFTLNDVKKKVIKNDIHEEIFDEDMKRRIQWVIMHKYENCFERLKKEWEPKLRQAGVAMIPTDPDAFAEMVFAHPSYKNRSTREPYAG